MILNGTTIKFMISQTKMPYSRPTITKFLCNHFIFGKIRKKKMVNEKAIKKCNNTPRIGISQPGLLEFFPTIPLAIKRKTLSGVLPRIIALMEAADPSRIPAIRPVIRMVLIADNLAVVVSVMESFRMRQEGLKKCCVMEKIYHVTVANGVDDNTFQGNVSIINYCK